MDPLRMSLKVDVDTRIGLQEGVPNLLALFQRFSIQATFFIALGPDNSGKAIRRIWKRGFLDKMRRTNPLKTYGLKTLLYGTLLRPPLVGQGAEGLIREVAAKGHEVGIHGYDHVRWQDTLRWMSQQEITQELAQAIRAYQNALGYPPASAAAPGWQCTAASLSIQDRYGFLYCSDTRGRFPFLPQMNGRSLDTLQIPTTTLTLDEVLGLDGIRPDNFNAFLLSQMKPDTLNVHTIHAELEGRRFLSLLEEFLVALQAQGAEFVRLCDQAKSVLQQGRGSIPREQVSWCMVPGRAGAVACQAASAAVLNHA